MKERPIIIPIASGKGGVGKSVFAANLAIALARLGHSTVAVDLDLGGANLHTCLGIPNHFPGIGDYMKSDRLRFEDLPVKTRIPNLSFIPGDGKNPFMANLSQKKRLPLVKKIRSIRAKYIILDLGAGTFFNTLTFFALSPRAIMITTFDTTSLMNCVMFLRNYIFRVITSVVWKEKKTLETLLQMFHGSQGGGPVIVDALIDFLRKEHPELAEKARKLCLRHHPRIVFNMAEHPSELRAMEKIDASLSIGLSLEAEFFGCLFYDERARRASKNCDILLFKYPQARISEGIERIANRVVTQWHQQDADSINRLMSETEKDYERWKQ